MGYKEKPLVLRQRRDDGPSTVPSPTQPQGGPLGKRAAPTPTCGMRLYVPRVVADRIMMQDDFVRLHEFLLETETISDISDELREVVEKEWPELAHKLPPKRGPPPS